MVNLALNSIQAMPQGGKLTIRVENSLQVDDETESQIRIHVQVQGDGIGRDDLTKIFTPFYTTRKKEYRIFQNVRDQGHHGVKPL